MAEFPATRLSIIERIREGDQDARQEALGVFVEDYREALTDFLVKAKRVNRTDADDLVSDFILNKIMNGKVLDLANGKGRFRSALRTCIQRYLIDSIRKTAREPFASEAAPDIAAAPESDSEFEINPLDRVWATAIFTSALTQMKHESQYWGLFRDRVLTQPPIGYEQVIERYGFKNPQKASNALMTAKRTFNRILSACIEAQTSLGPTSSDSGVADEARLLKIFFEDPEMIMTAVKRIKDRPAPSYSLTNLSTIGSSMVFVDPSADATWGKEETAKLFEHLLDQSLAELGLGSLVDGSLSLRKALDVNCSALQRADLVSLKDHFNQRGKSGKSELPRRIDVAMAFALICRFVMSFGTVADITSMTESELVERVEKMSDRPWLPREVGVLYASLIRRHRNDKASSVG